LMSHWMLVNYRQGYNIFGVSGILFNHESPRRGETFVTRKITMGIAMILSGKQEHLFLGNLEPKRDWGFAPEYVATMWKMLQRDNPEDFVIGTGETHSVQEFVEEAFSYAGLDWRNHVKIDPRYFRPTETESLNADPKNAREKLGWQPKVTFKELIKIMIDADMRKLGLNPIGEGDRMLKEKFRKRWWIVD
ncbi:GDP-mannose 4,6-dehydratase, partial [Desulfobacterota bacterium AH_259_B03_O07]|nr:GDP-mannose 4,6-dehydratase [Desulfobacterota bacterium AH_259_B03_O07]